MKPFSVAIITPEKTVYEGEAVSLVAPGALGFFGIWANHMPFISGLKAGTVVMKKNESETPVTFQIKQDGGFLEVLKDKVTLLIEDADVLNS